MICWVGTVSVHGVGYSRNSFILALYYSRNSFIFVLRLRLFQQQNVPTADGPAVGLIVNMEDLRDDRPAAW